MAAGATEGASKYSRSQVNVLSTAGRLVPKFSRTFAFYVAAITDFYATHSNVSRVPIGAIMSCLQDTPLLTCDQLAKVAAKTP